MNEFTIFNGTIWFSDADSVYKHLYPECGFEVESLGVSDRFVSEDAFIAQRNLKDEYMRRDAKHSEIISELRKELKERQDYIKNLEDRINNQNGVINKLIGCGMHSEDIMEKDNTIAQLEARNENQQKELANLNKILEKERNRNNELEELYSSAQRDVSMLNLKVMELNQGICDSADLTWKEKYDELENKYIADSTSLNGVINELRIRMKRDNEQNNEMCKKLLADIDHITERCGNAERTIDVIKETLIDRNYIHHIDLRRNNK